MVLFRANKAVKTGKSSHELDRQELFLDGDRVMCWAMTIDNVTTVTKRQFPSAAKARAWFKARVTELTREKYKVFDRSAVGWSIGPKGQCRHWSGKLFTSIRPWGDSVTVTQLDEPGEASLAKAKAKAKKKKQRAANPAGNLARIANDFALPTEAESYKRIVSDTNAWFAKLIDAGLDLQPFGRGAKGPAIRATGPYSAQAIAEFVARLAKPPQRTRHLSAPIDWSNATLPEHYLEVLREQGALSVLTDSRGAETMYPLEITRGWPLGSDVKAESDLLNWEIERHGEPGSFAGAHIRVRRWLRVCANAPGGSDHFSILDLNRTNSAGAAALYRVDDTGLPTTVTSKATVYSFKAWLVRAVTTLHSTVRSHLG